MTEFAWFVFVGWAGTFLALMVIASVLKAIYSELVRIADRMDEACK